MKAHHIGLSVLQSRVRAKYLLVDFRGFGAAKRFGDHQMQKNEVLLFVRLWFAFRLL